MAPAEPTGPRDDLYQVVQGDHLWGISGRPSIYGDPYRWPLIYRANQNQIQDADLIYPGQLLVIRSGAAQDEIDAAVRHARTRGAWTLGVVEDSDRRYLAGSPY
jgi:LysM repeat protein